MAIGVDIGSSGLTTAHDDGSCNQVRVAPAMRRVMADLAARVGDPVPLVFSDESGQACRMHPHELYAAEAVRAMRLTGADPQQTHWQTDRTVPGESCRPES